MAELRANDEHLTAPKQNTASTTNALVKSLLSVFNKSRKKRKRRKKTRIENRTGFNDSNDVQGEEIAPVPLSGRSKYTRPTVSIPDFENWWQTTTDNYEDTDKLNKSSFSLGREQQSNENGNPRSYPSAERMADKSKKRRLSDRNHHNTDFQRYPSDDRTSNSVWKCLGTRTENTRQTTYEDTGEFNRASFSPRREQHSNENGNPRSYPSVERMADKSRKRRFNEKNHDNTGKVKRSQREVDNRFDFNKERRIDSRKPYRPNSFVRGPQRRIRRVYDAVPMMQELLTQSPSEIILAVMDPTVDFHEAFRRGISWHNLFALLLDILAQAFTCDTLTQQLQRLLETMKVKNFFDIAVNYFMQMQSESSERQLEEFRKPMIDMLTIMTRITMKCTISYTQTVGVHTILKNAVEFMKEKSTLLDKDILGPFELFSNQEEKMRLKSLRKTQDRNVFERDVWYKRSPGDYRDCEIYPQMSDFEDQDDRFIRPIKVKGSYKNLDDYLDVQFRLLREDFVRPLRDGIRAYLQTPTEKSRNENTQDIRLYRNVHIVSPVCGQHGMFHELKFDVSGLKHIRWDSSKRLIFGSLLCLSFDNFKTIYFATVSERNPRLLQRGFVTVRFEGGERSVPLRTDAKFMMAESTAYFESYRHVLTGLQNTHYLPFMKYIVFCENEVMPPAYLIRNANLTYDLNPLADNDPLPVHNLPWLHADDLNEEDDGEVDLLDRTTWPCAEFLNLDGSQFKALRSALTKEFAIIQGPPGTGKTFIGLKIVKAFLHNKSVWNTHPQRFAHWKPLLIVCYTNHALDQFLEGIVSFCNGDVLRVGNRSTSEQLKACSLSSYRQRLRHTRGLSKSVLRRKGKIRSKMNDLFRKINTYIFSIKHAMKDIMHEDALLPFMDDHYELLKIQLNYIHHGDHSMFPNKSNDSYILEWLELGNVVCATRLDKTRKHNARQSDDQRKVEGDVSFEEQQRELDVSTDVLANQVTCAKNEEIVEIEARFRERYVALDVELLETQPKYISDSEWRRLRQRRKTLKSNLQTNICSRDLMTDPEADGIKDLIGMNIIDKWRLYRLWIKKYRDSNSHLLGTGQDKYKRVAHEYYEMLLQEDREIMKECSVIGMTTTGAARYQAVLHEIQPKIIVVEEAAEVLEAHIVTSVSRECEHLVLIGDHKQLRPKTTVHELAKDYKLDVSLFERMVKNGLQFDCLEYQHRMRPEIAELMSIIYENYKNHEDVNSFENIKGVSSNLFFIKHNERETTCNDSKSHSNEFEALYIAALCLYLIKQRYKPEQITVLTMYSGQLFALKSAMQNPEFERVRVTVVDNYQGEENDIILLSLVRSNDNGKIGFLNVDNRICVALSRAKKGLFVIGNFDMIFQHSKTKLWRSLIEHMKEKKLFGTGLHLYCQNHPKDDATLACKKEDFEKMPDGGCNRPCDYRLQCGHVCEKFCHATDPEHTDYKCRKPCIKLCDNEHRCTKTCDEECGNCIELMEKTVPNCGHLQQIECHVNPMDFSCKGECKEILSCGHPCKSFCGQPHTAKCMVLVNKLWPCGFEDRIPCCRRKTAPCTRKCDTVLECGHSCNGTCTRCCEGLLHQPCNQVCNKILVCDHECTGMCNECPPCVKPCENRCVHSKCHQPCGDLCQPCMELCQWECEHYQCSKRCSEPCDRPRCNEPCKGILPCGHPCIGICGETCPPYCRVCDNDKVTEIFFGTEDDPDSKFVLMEDCRAKCIIESNALDFYMDSLPREEHEIMLKACPKCKTTIRRSNRYGSIINKTIQDIERVKKMLLTNKNTLSRLEIEIQTELREHFDDKFNLIMSERLKSMQKPKTEIALTTIKNQLAILKRLKKVEIGLQVLNDDAFFEQCKRLTRSVKRLRQWTLVKRKTMSLQEITDSKCELNRLEDNITFLRHEAYLKEKNIEVVNSLKSQMKQAGMIFRDKKKYERQARDIVEKCLNELQKEAPLTVLGVDDEEQSMILKAMALPTGHWYKCPQGHIYAIGECGGAMVESRCPDCKSIIGGSRHRLRGDNELAREMDNAPYAAWSEQANLDNYEFLD